MSSLFSRMLGRLKPRTRQAALREISTRMDVFKEALFAPESEHHAAGPGADLKPLERWVLVRKILAEVPHAAIHFLHIPKTGGTTLTSAMDADPRFIVVSVDGQIDIFLQQLRRLVTEQERKIAFIRAHHGLSLLADSGASEQVAFSFATIREPAQIHASNANMIVRRIRHLLGDRSRSDEEKEYAARWLKIMHGRHEDTEQFAIDVLSTPEYLSEMGSVYAKLFDSVDWQQALHRNDLFCVCKEHLDELFSEALGYAKPPGRKNVTTRGPLSAERIPRDTLKRLIAKDQRIYSELNRQVTNSIALSSKLRALIKVH